MFSRRRFLHNSSAISLAPWLPRVVGNTARAATPGSDEKVLVVIQLDGGNDGLNTVVPFGDDGYGRARTKLRLKSKDLLKIDDHIGLHPSMRSVKELFDDGRFSIVHGVGYPNPDRSHFRSMKIWQTASFDNQQHDGNGWLGRTLDQGRRNESAKAIYVGSDDTPVALWGRSSEAISLSRAEDLHLALDVEPFQIDHSKGRSDLDQFVAGEVHAAYASAKEFERRRKATAEKADASYPNTRLGQNLKLVSQLLKSGTKTRVFYTSQGGYDTHSAQQFDHARLLAEYSNAVKSLLDDLAESGLDDRVVVLTFSEFGRRVHENSSLGTDHGTAGPVFLAGKPVKGGLSGTAPDLSDLVDGDLKVGTDFRRIYATILKDWLEVDPAVVLKEDFETLSLFG